MQRPCFLSGNTAFVDGFCVSPGDTEDAHLVIMMHAAYRSSSTMVTLALTAVSSGRMLLPEASSIASLEA